MAMGFGQLGKVFVGGGRQPVGALPVPLPLSGAHCLVVSGPFSRLSRALRRAAVLRRARFAALEPRRALAVVPMAIAGLLGVSMPALAAVLFDPLPPGEESVAPITPPPPAKPLTGTEWRAQDPRRGSTLLPVEMRPKQRIPCAEALSDERLRNPADALEEMGWPNFSELFRSNVEVSDCKKTDLLSYMDNVGAVKTGSLNNEKIIYYDFDLGILYSPIIWIPEMSAVLAFDDANELIVANWGVKK